MAGEFKGPRVECTIDSLLNRYIVNWLLDTCLYFQIWPAPNLGQRSLFSLWTEVGSQPYNWSEC